MRPDRVLMKRLNVSIPRLSPAESFINNPYKNSINSTTTSFPSAMEEEDDLVVIETTSDSMKTNEISILSSETNNNNNNKDIDYCDQDSVCSESSVLSVGQEATCKINQKNLQQIPAQTLLLNSNDESNDLSSLKVNQHFQRSGNSAFNFADLQNPPQTTLASLAANPGNASFQNFFLKNSLYAEELMKQQMKLMAGVISLKTAPTFIERPNLTNLQSHLNTISQLSAAAAAAAALTAASNNVSYNPQTALQNNILMDLSRVGFPDRRKSQDTTALEDHLNHNHHPHHHHHPHNNETALKFSIDNILKADFGRKSDEEGPQSSFQPSIPNKHKKRSSEPSKNSTQAFKASFESRKILPLGFSNSLENIISSQKKDPSFYKDDSCNKSDREVLSPSFSESSVEKLDKNLLGGKSQEGNSSLDTSSTSGSSASGGSSSSNGTTTNGTGSDPIVWPAWVYCTRYSDRPSSGRSPRTRKPKKSSTPSEKGSGAGSGSGSGAGGGGGSGAAALAEDKRPRTAFSSSQLARLKHEFNENRYLTEKRRQQLSSELGLNEAQIKIWFQNKRAKLKKSSGTKNPLALQLMAQGLYNHSTIPLTKEEEELQEMQEREFADDDSP